jgi:hypothetical protein
METTEALTTSPQVVDFVPKAVMSSELNKTEEPVNFMDNAICLSLEIRCLGNRRKVSSNSVTTPADKEFLHITKDLIDHKYMKELTALHGELRAFVGKKCLPATSLFRRGTYLIPNVAVDKIYPKIKEFKIRQNELVEKLVEVYEAAQEDAATRLGPLYNPMDYPSKEDVRHAYGINYKLVAFSTPNKLKEISGAYFHEEAEKAKEALTAATDEIKLMLRQQLADFTSHLVEKLTPAVDGKKKIFHESSIKNFKEFLDDFNALNIVDDTELKILVEKARGCIDGVVAKDLRSNDSLKEKVQKDFTDIRDAVNTMLINAPKRQFDFSDDGE